MPTDRVVVPDEIGTVRGWRMWALSERLNSAPVLNSLVQESMWKPGSPMVARCLVSAHDAPERDCWCGLWSKRSLLELLREFDPEGVMRDFCPVYVVGVCEFWGRICEQERGMRAEFGYPLELWVIPSVSHANRWMLGRLGGWAAHLRMVWDRPCHVATVEEVAQRAVDVYGEEDGVECANWARMQPEARRKVRDAQRWGFGAPAKGSWQVAAGPSGVFWFTGSALSAGTVVTAAMNARVGPLRRGGSSRSVTVVTVAKPRPRFRDHPLEWWRCRPITVPLEQPRVVWFGWVVLAVCAQWAVFFFRPAHTWRGDLVFYLGWSAGIVAVVVWNTQLRRLRRWQRRVVVLPGSPAAGPSPGAQVAAGLAYIRNRYGRSAGGR